MVLRWVLTVLLGGAGALAVAAPSRPDTSGWSAGQWQAAARGDILAAHQIYVANHPGIDDRNNPGFAAQLARARDAGLRLASEARDSGSYANALGAFSVEMADHHAGLGAIPLSSAPPTFEWPGFIPAWRGDALYVHTVGDAAGVTRGDRILSCDGLEVAALARRNLATNRSYPLTSGEYWMVGGAPFNSTAETKARRANRCRIAGVDGKTRELTLAWRAAPADFIARRTIARAGQKEPIALTEPRPGLFLAAMPTFGPNEEEIARYRAMFAAMNARRAELQRGRALIIDLRHNGGGSSSWSAQAARILWGDALVDRQLATASSEVVWWRASQGNTDYVSTWEALFRKQGQPEKDLAWARKIGGGMRNALTRGEQYFVERDEPAEIAATALTSAQATPFTTPVYVITHGHCASACLDALDLFKGFANVKLIGAPSASDTNYLDVRGETLPSGLGTIVIPQKVYVGRKRASGAHYDPDVVVTDLDWSTATFLDRVEADLKRRK